MASQPPLGDPYLQKRQLMVQQQLQRRGIEDPRVLAVMVQVPRHLFVDRSLEDQAYDDNPLNIGNAQTISQPYMVARMAELCALKPTDRVLEVGAGSGYQTAVLAALCRQVFACEILEQLAELARQNLNKVTYENITLERRDGSLGWPEQAPFDAIVVAAGAPAVPDALKDQLADGGRLVIPVGSQGIQVLHRIIRQGDRWVKELDTPCRFVKLGGKFGWHGEADR